jgi:hypothetical protein
MERVTRFARWLRRVAIAGIVVTFAVTGAAIAGSGRLVSLSADGLPRSWAAAIAVLLAGLLVAALFALCRMLAHVERGDIFAPAATRYFRRFAILLLLGACAELFLPMLVGAILSLVNGSGSFVLSADGADALSLFLTAVLFLIARLFDEAARLDEDSRSIV